MQNDCEDYAMALVVFNKFKKQYSQKTIKQRIKIMSLDLRLQSNHPYRGHIMPYIDWEGSVTHNLITMADACGLYEPLWRPESLFPDKASEDSYSTNITGSDIYPFILKGLSKLLEEPEKHKKLSPSNGWGTYEGMVCFTANFLEACSRYPNSKVYISR